jgi:WD40 repeat protein
VDELGQSNYASCPATSGVSELEAVFETRPAVAHEARYRERVLIGSGQMGRVESAYDTLLRRKVALKVLRADASANARIRFAREASITAGLEHPGIVTVHDSGTLDDGRPYYTMQLVQGGSWDAQSDSDIDQALDRVAAIGEAVGHAHARGIVHRDLKPANVMVGPFGEVVVVDWGLATIERQAHEADETIPSADSGLTAHGAIVGTPLYMSPEQARGEPVSPSADVWALGVMLYERIAGRHPLAGLPADAVLARVLVGDVPPLDAKVSPELTAIVERALPLDPAARYPSGREFAADLRNFVAGRRVSAYVYRPRDLLGRFVRSHWLALAVATATLAVLLAIGAVSYARTVIERDHARAAERVALEQQHANERLSGRLLAAQARVAAAAGDLAAAEFLAEAALARGESADARGVLASMGFENHPVDVHTRPSPCRDGKLSTRGAHLLCSEREAVQLYPTDTLAPGLRVELDDVFAGMAAIDETEQVWIATDDGRVVGLERDGTVIQALDMSAYELAAHGPTIQVGAVEASQFRTPDGAFVGPEPVCADAGVADVGYANGRLLVVCIDGSASFDGEPPTLVPDGILATTNLVLPLDDGRFFLGREDGRVVVFDPVTRSWELALTGARRINDATDLHDGLVALTTEDMDTLIWDVETASVVVRLPPSWGAAHARRHDGAFVSVGTSVRTWRLPNQRSTSAFQAEFGLSMATTSARGHVVVGAVADGSVVVWNGDDGQLRWRAYWPKSSVLKSATLTRDERHIVGITAHDGRVRVFDVDDGRPVHTLTRANAEGSGGRRLMTLADGSVWASTYGLHLVRWPSLGGEGEPPPEPEQLLFGRIEDGSASEHGTAAVWLEERTDVVALVRTGSSTLQRLGVVEGASAVDVDDDHDVIIVGRDHDVLVLDVALEERQRWTGLPAAALDVSVRGDGSLVAAGLRDGSILVWRVGAPQPLARMFGHQSRVSSVDFVGDALVSAGWDGNVRRWAIAPMLASPEALQQAEQRWGEPSAELRTLLEPG